MQLGQLHAIPALAPQDITSTTTASDIIDAGEGHEIEFDVYFGVITGDTATLTLEECDDISASNSSAIAFNYQKSSATGTDSMGAVAAATTSGITIAATDDNKMVRVYVDPSALSSGYPYVRVNVAPGGSMSACLVSVVAVVRPRYPQEQPASMVD